MPRHKKNEKPLFVRITKEERIIIEEAMKIESFHSISEWVRTTLLKTAKKLHENS